MQAESTGKNFGKCVRKKYGTTDVSISKLKNWKYIMIKNEMNFDVIRDNSMLGMDLFYEEFRKSLIFHIPHSKTEIPEKYKSDYMSVELIDSEIKLLTDFATDEIFNIPDSEKIIFPYSRVFCDVERLDDENEIMFQLGRGFYYTKTDCGKLLRETTSKEIAYEAYYKEHHRLLTNLVAEKLKNIGFATIIDCHSFSDHPFTTDIEQSPNRPDFCLGTDDFHTPDGLVKPFYDFLKEKGYSVEINHPYSGTMVPIEYYKCNKSVYSLMIEVNRKLYMANDSVNYDKVRILNDLFKAYFER